MKRIGICQKCGETKIVRDHHIHGYEGENKDDVVPYCVSCDFKAHAKARREGRCKLTGEESYRKSTNSYARRSLTRISISSRNPLPNIQLEEFFNYNKNTETLSFCTGFHGNHGYKIKVIEELI